MIKLVRELPVLSLRLVRSTGLAALLAAGVAGAQTEGVVFVEDIQEQAQRLAQQSNSARTNQYQAPAPSQRSRFPQPSVNGMPSGGQQMPLKQQMRQEEESGWSFKKTLGGLFGGNKEQQQQTIQPATASGRMGSTSGNAAVAPNRKMLTSQTAQSQAAQESTKRPTRPTLFGGSNERPNPNAMRGTGLSSSTSRDSNKPVGLFSLLSGGDKEAKTQPRERNTPVLPTPSYRQEPVAKPEPRRQRTPEPMVAMVTDRDESVAAQPKQPTGANTAQASQASKFPSLAQRNAPMPRPASMSPASMSPSSQLPVVTTPAASSDTLQARTAQQPAGRASNMPMPINTVQQAGAQQPISAPREIVNEHAMAQAAAAAKSMPPQRKLVSPAPKPQPVQPKPVAVAEAMPYPTAQPANPVTPPEAKSAEPSEKAIALLTEANQQSSVAKTEAEYTQVIQLCRHVLAIDQSQVCIDYSHDLASWALNRRGELRTDEGRIKEALLDFEDALRLDPERYRAIHNRGVLAAQAGRFADAFDDFNRTIELNPEFAKAFSNRAALWMRAGELEKSSADYRQAIAIDPDLAVAHKGRGRVCHMLGQFTLALQHMDAAAHLSPGDAYIACNRGDLLMDMGRYRSAKADYERAIELDNSLAVAYRNLAWLQATCPDRECRNAQLALASAKRALELCGEPTDLEYDTLAAAHATAGDFEAAQAAMQKCMEAASEKDKPNYLWRKQLYEQGQAYITEPASDVQQASYAE
ncbi:tetratricopeptide repeat protein [Aeoliella sp.]|uniref:tetratricopeptide repeat protein n=1 Tax=Aeoliella sp. TaxID=2795800 RepID=UPI003CCBB5AD